MILNKMAAKSKATTAHAQYEFRKSRQNIRFAEHESVRAYQQQVNPHFRTLNGDFKSSGNLHKRKLSNQVAVPSMEQLDH